MARETAAASPVQVLQAVYPSPMPAASLQALVAYAHYDYPSPSIHTWIRTAHSLMV
jgi:hypothetical protein